MSSTNFRIEPLSKDNFDTWQIQVEALLRKSRMWDFVNGKNQKPVIDPTKPETGGAAEKWENDDQDAKSDLILTLSPSELKHIKGCKTSRDVWMKLKQIHQSTGPAKKATLLRQLITARMKEGQDVKEYLSNFIELVEKLQDMEIPIHQDLLAIIMLHSLPESFENFRCAILSRDELPTPEILRIKIIEESEARSENCDRSQQSDALLVKKNKFKKPTTTRTTDQLPFRFKCHICKQKGHKSSDCPQKKSQKDQQAGTVTALMAEKSSGIEKWCVDSGCTTHMCKTKKRFEKIEKSNLGRVNLASDGSIPVLGQGQVPIRVQNSSGERNISLENTLFVPELRTNLLSVAKIVDKGFTVTFDKRQALALGKNGEILLTADRIGDLFYLREDASQETAQLTYEGKNDLSIDLWHQRLGHLNEKDLRSMSKTVKGLKFKKTEMSACEVCLQGKISQSPFPKKSERKTKLLDIIHSDICGPMRVKSIGGAAYFITFIDDATRWCEVMFLKKKSEALEAFKIFKNKVEKKTGKTIKCLQSDNGLEYKNKLFNEFLEAEGISRRLTVVETPQQNGISERKNRTLVETARCMMISANMAPAFWAEAVNTANYIRNRCKSRSIDGKIPYELWTGQRTNVGYFKTFGCIGYALEKRKNRGKFDSKTNRCVFLGYSEETKGFKVWYPDQRKVGFTRDVKFLNKFGCENEQFREFIEVKSNEDTTENKMVEIEFHQKQPRARTQRTEEEETSGNLNLQSDSETPEQILPNTNENFLERTEVFTNEETENPEIENVETTNNEVRREKNVIPETPILRRSKRVAKKKVFDCCVTGTEIQCEPAGEVKLKEALSGPSKKEWMAAIESEYVALLKNGVWDIVEKPPNRKCVGNRLILTNKFKKDGTLDRRKARLVARGFTQQPGTDYQETYNPVIRMRSVRTILATAVKKGMVIHQMDVTTAYLNGVISEEIYMNVPDQYEQILEQISNNQERPSEIRKMATQHIKKLSGKNKVCKIKKALYGLKQSGRMWYQKLDKTLKSLNLKSSTADPCVYTGEIDGEMVILGVYVDDLILATNSDNTMTKLKDSLKSKFEMKDLGPIHYCLGIEISYSQKEGELKLTQKKYINQILKRFGMENCNPISTPADVNQKLKKPDVPDEEEMQRIPYQNGIGALMYLSTSTRPDISHTISSLSQFNTNYSKEHWSAVKRVFRYVQGTQNYALTYSRSEKSELQGYVDADWGSCVEDRRSYTGYVFLYAGGAISWEARKQKTVALSSTEAEYMAMTEATKEAICLKNLLADLNVIKPEEPVSLKNDNRGAQELARNPVYHSRTKHIDIRHHFVREAVEEKKIVLQHTPTEEMTADILTKALPGPRHTLLLSSLGLQKNPKLEGEY
ncbi:Hydra magnipapillata [Nesidiocoris tenuis]|uniref:Hydra magnipapillata n=1 Tax=Nesidiocoris tenuis TaxID=355587 RepID=A0ABN7B0X0_9HEMI|nr:Hydra magnipapillata [Nesidiocoris tenuis]